MFHAKYRPGHHSCYTADDRRKYLRRQRTADQHEIYNL